jgi:hypothetical protein
MNFASNKKYQEEKNINNTSFFAQNQQIQKTNSLELSPMV